MLVCPHCKTAKDKIIVKHKGVGVKVEAENTNEAVVKATAELSNKLDVDEKKVNWINVKGKCPDCEWEGHLSKFEV